MVKGKKNFEAIETGRTRVIDQIEKAAAAPEDPAPEKREEVRTSICFDKEVFDYIKTIGAARYGSMVAYLEALVKKDREAWKDKEEQLKALLSE